MLLLLKPRKLLILLLVLVLVGCLQLSQNLSSSPTSYSTTSVSVTHASEEPTATPLSSLALTWTPVTKLNKEDAWVQILEMYEDNNYCKLPCWWNFVPGKTLWSQINDELGPLGTIVLSGKTAGMASYVFLFDLPDVVDSPPSQLVAGFIIERDVVQAISVSSMWINRDFDYSLAGILKYLGPPTDIWIRLFPESADGMPHYDMQIYFLNKGVWVWVIGDATISNDVMTICPQDPIANPAPRGLFLWNLKRAKSASDVQKTFEFFWTEGLRLEHYKLLEDLQSNFDTKEFYATYLNSYNLDCFKVNAESFYNP